MNQTTHTIIVLLSLYFVWRIGRTMQKKSLVEEIVNETLNKLEKLGAIKYEIQNGEKVFQSMTNSKNIK